jgi:dnd system-associated protein 4
MRGIRRDKQYAALTDMLTEKDPRSDTAVFPSKKALQCFAAILGFEAKSRISLPSGAVDSIEWHTFENGEFTDYIYLVALGSTKDLSVLRYDVDKSDPGDFDEDMVTVFEEFANGGFEIIQRWLNKTPNDRHGTKAILSGLQSDEYLSVQKNERSARSFPEVEF